LFTLKDKKEIVSLSPESAQFSLFVLDIKRCNIRPMGTFMFVRTYLLIFRIDPISIESVAPEWASLVVCLMITLAIRAVAPVGTYMAFRSRWDREFAVGVTSAAPCKFVVGILEMGFAAPWAHWCPFRAVFIRVAPPPALLAKWGTN
jgi:hypothetical protein